MASEERQRPPSTKDDPIDTPEEVMAEIEDVVAEAAVKGTAVDVSDLPDNVRLKVVVQKRGLIFGALLDLAIEVLLQQFGIVIFDVWSLVRAIAIGSAIGILMPTLGYAAGAFMANKELQSLREDLATKRAADLAAALPNQPFAPSYHGGEEQ